MILYYCEMDEGNFGDDLNPWLWPQVLPQIDFEDDDGWCFVGIGTLLNDFHFARLPPLSRKLIFGAGAGIFGPGSRPVAPDPTWEIVALRGPLTAEVLGVSRDLAVTDGAALVAELAVEPSGETGQGVYVPHVSNVHRGWSEVCEAAGLQYVDPRDGVERVLRSLAGADVVLAEAMHAAIVADALRVPWVPVRTAWTDEFKWRDWCASLELEYEPYWIPRHLSSEAGDDLYRRTVANLSGSMVAGRLRWLRRRGRRFLSSRRVFHTRLDELKRRRDRVGERWGNGWASSGRPLN